MDPQLKTNILNAFGLTGLRDGDQAHGLRLVVSAVAELESGNLDAACEQGVRAVEVAGRISSVRTTEYVRDLLHRLEPYGDEPRVVELRERARPLLMTTA